MKRKLLAAIIALGCVFLNPMVSGAATNGNLLEVSEKGEKGDSEVTAEDIAGNYMDINSGLRLSIAADGNSEIEDVWRGYAYEPYMNPNPYKIEDNKFISRSDDGESWDIIKTENGIHLENDKSTYVPEAEYRTFSFTTPYKLGDEVTSENLSLTVTDYVATDSAISSKIVQVSPAQDESGGYLYPAAKGKCYANIQFNVKNTSTNPFYVDEVVSVSLVYDNKYQFYSYETEGNMLTVYPDGCKYVLDTSSSYGSTPMLSALCDTTCIADIMCPEEVMNSTDKSLYAVFQVEKADKSVEVFVYDLRS